MKNHSFFSIHRKVSLLAVLALILTACGSKEDYQWEDWNEAENVASVSVQSEDGTTEELEPGTTMGIYIIDENGNLTWVVVEVDENGNVILPPEALSGKAVVYTPVQSSWGLAAFTGSPKFYIKSDQSDEDGYEASDLMIGTMSSVSGTRGAGGTRGTGLRLSLKHMLAKVVIHVIDETGMMDFDQVSMQLLKMRNGVSVSLAQQEVETLENSSADIDMLAYNSTDRRISMMAIVPSQLIGEGEEFFKINMPGNSRVGVLPSETMLEADKTFVYQVRYTENGPVFESSFITKWEDDGSEAILDIRTSK